MGVDTIFLIYISKVLWRLYILVISPLNSSDITLQHHEKHNDQWQQLLHCHQCRPRGMFNTTTVRTMFCICVVFVDEGF